MSNDDTEDAYYSAQEHDEDAAVSRSYGSPSGVSSKQQVTGARSPRAPRTARTAALSVRDRPTSVTPSARIRDSAPAAELGGPQEVFATTATEEVARSSSSRAVQKRRGDASHRELAGYKDDDAKPSSTVRAGLKRSRDTDDEDGDESEDDAVEAVSMAQGRRRRRRITIDSGDTRMTSAEMRQNHEDAPDLEKPPLHPAKCIAGLDPGQQPHDVLDRWLSRNRARSPIGHGRDRLFSSPGSWGPNEQRRVADVASAIAKLGNRVVDLSEQNRKQGCALAEYRRTIRAQRKELADKDTTIREQGTELADKDWTIHTQEIELADKDWTIHTQENELADKDTTIRAQEIELADKDTTIRTQKKEVALKKGVIHTQKKGIQKAKNRFNEKFKKMKEKLKSVRDERDLLREQLRAEPPRNAGAEPTKPREDGDRLGRSHSPDPITGVSRGQAVVSPPLVPAPARQTIPPQNQSLSHPIVGPALVPTPFCTFCPTRGIKVSCDKSAIQLIITSLDGSQHLDLNELLRPSIIDITSKSHDEKGQELDDRKRWSLVGKHIAEKVGAFLKNGQVRAFTTVGDKTAQQLVPEAGFKKLFTKCGYPDDLAEKKQRNPTDHNAAAKSRTKSTSDDNVKHCVRIRLNAGIAPGYFVIAVYVCPHCYEVKCFHWNGKCVPVLQQG